jgi:hypothetical protein
MNDEIMGIVPIPCPFSYEDKIFYENDDEGNPIGEPYSVNDWIKMLNNVSGLTEELSGNCADKPKTG